MSILSSLNVSFRQIRQSLRLRRLFEACKISLMFAIGETVTRLRTERGWTQKELAEKLEMHPNHVSRMEKDKTQPRRSTVEKLAEVFEVDSNVFHLGGETTVSTLAEEDPELAELIAQVSLLDTEQRQALRTTLKSMLMCRKFKNLAAGEAV